jgi:hypothetical protein
MIVYLRLKMYLDNMPFLNKMAKVNVD